MLWFNKSLWSSEYIEVHGWEHFLLQYQDVVTPTPLAELTLEPDDEIRRFRTHSVTLVLVFSNINLMHPSINFRVALKLNWTIVSITSIWPLMETNQNLKSPGYSWRFRSDPAHGDGCKDRSTKTQPKYPRGDLEVAKPPTAWQKRSGGHFQRELNSNVLWTSTKRLETSTTRPTSTIK